MVITVLLELVLFNTEAILPFPWH